MVPYDLLYGLMLLLPFVGGAICVALPSPRQILATMCATVAASALVCSWIVYRVFSGGPAEAAGGLVYVDALSAYHLCVMMMVFVASSLYSWGYFLKEANAGRINRRGLRQFAGLWCGALAAMTLVLISNNLGIMWVGIEATTLLTAFLICIPVRPASLEAMWKYLLICSVGVAFAFLGTLMVAASASGLHLNPSDTLLWTKLRQSAALLNPMLLKTGFLCLLVGYGTKAGLAPMHSWLPDAHSQAPAPVSAIFSGFMLNAALYCVMRYVPIVEITTGHVGWSLQLLVLFGLVSIIVAAAFIIFQHNVKRLLAYSSVEHIGIITLGIRARGTGHICRSLSYTEPFDLQNARVFRRRAPWADIWHARHEKNVRITAISPGMGNGTFRQYPGADWSRAFCHIYERIPGVEGGRGWARHSNPDPFPGRRKRCICRSARACHCHGMGQTISGCGT